ncbi:6-deoxy-6-sulfogluconolactonase [Tepidimonas charontis]|uniref:6-deoxy-6-sulfogluconolactonase n=1 Tax=Tepidimonas charontis TaxID=2267262 RepID=A0A554X654_9BURK|nr:6-deoxy-6-sulfogluconolactonase [Tepidimonas charontis]
MDAPALLLESGIDPGVAGWTCLTPPACARGQSPVWLGIEDRLYWLDTGLQRLWRLHVPSGHSEWRELPQTPGGLMPCRRGGWLLALRDGVYHLPAWDLPLQRIAEAPYDVRRCRFDAAVCDPWGRLWLASSAEACEHVDGALYCLRARDRQRPELVLVRSGWPTSAALVWSVDGQTLYWTDGTANALWALPMLDPARWPPQLGAPMPSHRLLANAGNTGRLAGATVDRDGRYWVAREAGARVQCLSPSGHVLLELPLPVRSPTAVVFGGPDLRSLFVVSARQHRSASELNAHPNSGAVFARRLAVTGVPAARYWD